MTGEGGRERKKRGKRVVVCAECVCVVCVVCVSRVCACRMNHRCCGGGDEVDGKRGRERGEMWRGR